jgi:hypothetical protein
MISIITDITRRKLFRYASHDCVCEFISEPWEWLHEASSRVSSGPLLAFFRLAALGELPH